jgi:hypothetical protein
MLYTNNDPPIYDVDGLEGILGVNEDEDWMPTQMDGKDESVAEEWESQFGDDEELPENLEDEDTDDTDVDQQEALQYAIFVNTFKPFDPDEHKDTFLTHGSTLDKPEGVDFENQSSKCYEHIAGPGCKHRSGYSGHCVTSQEMRGCKTIQCLAPKPANWKPEPDDLEVEQTSRYFLTGISDYCPSRDISDIHVLPERHHLRTPPADVHPYAVCFVHRARLID